MNIFFDMNLHTLTKNRAHFKTFLNQITQSETLIFLKQQISIPSNLITHLISLFDAMSINLVTFRRRENKAAAGCEKKNLPNLCTSSSFLFRFKNIISFCCEIYYHQGQEENKCWKMSRIEQFSVTRALCQQA